MTTPINPAANRDTHARPLLVLRPVEAERVVTADAKTVSGAEFYNALFPDAAAHRAKARDLSICHCINAIKAGDTYGFPPSLVRECKAIMLHEEAMKSEVRL